MKAISVFKIGGSVLNAPEDFLRIAKVLSSKESAKCIVTSAMKGKTTELIDTYLKALHQPDFWQFEKFVGQGEIQSALLFESCFKQLGIKAKAILPGMKEWPLFISLKNRPLLSREKINEKRDFQVLKKSYKKVKRYTMPLYSQNQVLIVPGFIACDGRGRILTLGRGGSDISAFLFSELLKAKELVFIKETDGVFNMDPRLQNEAKKITIMNADELGLIASSGAQVMNPISLKHQKKLKNVHVTSLQALDRNEPGTNINFDKTISVRMSPHTYSVLTFVGDRIPETPGLLDKISGILAGNQISIYSITISDNLIALYVEAKDGERSYKLLSPILNKLKNLKYLNLKKNIGKLRIRSLKFINEPGVIKKIVSPISKKGINIWEVLTAHTDVMVFVEHQDLQKTYTLIRQLFKQG